jgi:hypothetical protein
VSSANASARVQVGAQNLDAVRGERAREVGEQSTPVASCDGQLGRVARGVRRPRADECCGLQAREQTQVRGGRRGVEMTRVTRGQQRGSFR